MSVGVDRGWGLRAGVTAGAEVVVRLTSSTTVLLIVMRGALRGAVCVALSVAVWLALRVALRGAVWVAALARGSRICPAEPTHRALPHQHAGDPLRVWRAVAKRGYRLVEKASELGVELSLESG